MPWPRFRAQKWRRAPAHGYCGGLGMGFTLASALQHLGADTEVQVAELVPGVIGWNRGPLGAMAGNPLNDLRTTVLNEDVANVLQAEPKGFDAIMLDVDNGPEGLTHSANNWLYSLDGLAACTRALSSKGILARKIKTPIIFLENFPKRKSVATL